MPTATPPHSKKAGRVLIAEDETELLEILQLVLEDEGHQVVGAKLGRAAVAAAKSGKFDVAILDISMPDVSGIEVAEALRAAPETAGIRIAIHTGLGERWVRERFTDYDLYLPKVDDVDVLTAAIARLVATPRQTAKASAGPSFTTEQALRARTALRKAMGTGDAAADQLSLAGLSRLLGDEIAELRKHGKSVAEIAALLASATGVALAEHDLQPLLGLSKAA